MPRFVALLRGVNVGKGKRVPMAAFKSLLEGLGYTGVRTVLNSGNAVFTSAGRSPGRHAAAIADALELTLGVSTPVIVKSAAQWAAVVGASPIDPPDTDHARYFVSLAADEATLLALAPLQAQARPPEQFVVTQVAAFLHSPAGILKSRVGEALLGRAGRHVTTRNWATVLRLRDEVRAGGD